MAWLGVIRPYFSIQKLPRISHYQHICKMKTSVLTLIAIAVSNALGESCAPGHLVCGHVLLGYSKYIRAILQKKLVF